MKSCLGILLVFFTCVAVFGGGALIWYLSRTAEFSRKSTAPTAVLPELAPPAPPRAAPMPSIPAPTPAPKPAPTSSSPFGER